MRAHLLWLWRIKHAATMLASPFVVGCSTLACCKPSCTSSRKYRFHFHILFRTSYSTACACSMKPHVLCSVLLARPLLYHHSCHCTGILWGSILHIMLGSCNHACTCQILHLLELYMFAEHDVVHTFLYLCLLNNSFSSRHPPCSPYFPSAWVPPRPLPPVQLHVHAFPTVAYRPPATATTPLPRCTVGTAPACVLSPARGYTA